MKHIAAIFILLFLFNQNWSQISEGGIPETWKKSSNPHTLPTKENKVLPSFDIHALRKEDSINDKEKHIPPRFAYAHKVDFSCFNSGHWTTTKGGMKIWRLFVQSPGAHSLNFTFSKFHLPQGGKLFLYNHNISHHDLIGAFTYRNNKSNGTFSTVPVRGDAIILEYNAPAGSPDPEIELSHIAHDYRNFFGILKNFGDAGACNIDVACSQGDTVRPQISSVALNINENGTRWCSGTMIANTRMDNTPYYLTAHHCVSGHQSQLANWVFVFNYESPSCGGGDGVVTQSISGSSLRANDATSDFALLELSSVPPDNFDVFYSGWNRSTTPATNAFGIHHPSGDVKKISTYNQPPSAVTSPLLSWKVSAWTEGTTEGGSSGSALFDEHKRVIGQLYGGMAACNGAVDNDQPDYYGRLDVSWDGTAANKRLRDWLDPDNTGALTQNGYNPSVSVAEVNNLVIKVFPNPANEALRFSTAENKGNYLLLDVSGRVVRYGHFAQPINTISTHDLSSGQYLLQITTSNKKGNIPLLILHP